MNFTGKQQASAEETSLLNNHHLSQFFFGKNVHWVTDVEFPPTSREDTETKNTFVSYHALQERSDYRILLQTLFSLLNINDYLIVVVPHAFLYERRLSLPSPWNIRQKRLYTPSSLMMEIEEALVPNSYRVRWLGDLDGKYDYRSAPDMEPEGESDIALVMERIEMPAWSLDSPPALDLPLLAGADFAFEPERTRVEIDDRPAIKRVLVLKLDHLGDFIMGLPALVRLRRYFADASIDLVVGSWNMDMAKDLGIADRVIQFDAFPRNSSEEEPNVPATLGIFRSIVTDRYDLAIDLRADIDTRPLLKAVRANLKAGIGTRQRFPFLDIALPLDSTRNDPERARENAVNPQAFSIQGSGRRKHFALYSDKHTVERDCSIVWGPYLKLDPGDYIFDFYIDIEDDYHGGLLRLDVAFDRGQTVAEMFVSGPSNYHLPFRVDKPGTIFEARIATVEGHPSISFGFHGGRLIKRGPENVLHQTEYACLLAELIKMRVMDFGTLSEAALT